MLCLLSCAWCSVLCWFGPRSREHCFDFKAFCRVLCDRYSWLRPKMRSWVFRRLEFYPCPLDVVNRGLGISRGYLGQPAPRVCRRHPASKAASNTVFRAEGFCWRETRLAPQMPWERGLLCSRPSCENGQLLVSGARLRLSAWWSGPCSPPSRCRPGPATVGYHELLHAVARTAVSESRRPPDVISPRMHACTRDPPLVVLVCPENCH